ncbi:MAG: DUF3667 domain-containing protein, partial [Bacteroidota bacterium]
MPHINNYPASSSCLNCQHPLPEDAAFCPHCGQKRTTGRVTFKQLLGDFFENLFNVDSRVFLTLRKTIYPGYLTSEYFRGKHKTYLHPLRLFLVTHILLVASRSSRSSEIIVTDV